MCNRQLHYVDELIYPSQPIFEKLLRLDFRKGHQFDPQSTFYIEFSTIVQLYYQLIWLKKSIDLRAEDELYLHKVISLWYLPQASPLQWQWLWNVQGQNFLDFLGGLWLLARANKPQYASVAFQGLSDNYLDPISPDLCPQVFVPHAAAFFACMAQIYLHMKVSYRLHLSFFHIATLSIMPNEIKHQPFPLYVV